MPRAGSQPKLKAWRLPPGCHIPPFKPFRASEIGLPNGEVNRLSREGFIEAVGMDRTECRSKRNIWRATGRLLDETIKGRANYRLDEHSLKILKLIKENPGITTATLAEKLDCTRRKVQHGIYKLNSEKFVRSVKCIMKTSHGGSGYCRHYLHNDKYYNNNDDTMLALIKGHPGITHAGLMGAMAESSSTIDRRIKRLKGRDLITSELEMIKSKKNGHKISHYYIKEQICQQ